jgi:uncharacterized membrane protein YphA (DoxX/SURF4 family)
LPILYITVAVTVAFVGPGLYSLDHVLNLYTAIPRLIAGIVLACGVFAAFGSLALRHIPERAVKS